MIRLRLCADANRSIDVALRLKDVGVEKLSVSEAGLKLFSGSKVCLCRGELLSEKIREA